MGITRRPILKGLLSVPAVALAADWLGRHDLGGNSLGPEFESMTLAVRALRIVNTAAAQHYQATRIYPAMGEFETSPPIQSWFNKAIAAVSAGATGAYLDAPLYTQLTFASAELVPGWRVEYKRTDNGDDPGYVVLLTPSSPTFGRKSVPSFATDASGVIHQGAVNATVTLREAHNARQLIIGHPIRVKHDDPSKFRTLLRGLAVGIVTPVYAQGEGECEGCGSITNYVCCTYPCYCCSQCCDCEGSSSGTSCWNCGCACCPWCCHDDFNPNCS